MPGPLLGGWEAQMRWSWEWTDLNCVSLWCCLWCCLRTSLRGRSTTSDTPPTHPRVANVAPGRRGYQRKIPGMWYHPMSRWGESRVSPNNKSCDNCVERSALSWTPHKARGISQRRLTEFKTRRIGAWLTALSALLEDPHLAGVWKVEQNLAYLTGRESKTQRKVWICFIDVLSSPWLEGIQCSPPPMLTSGYWYPVQESPAMWLTGT